MLICEQCGKEHDGKFGSGRFCNRSCSTRWVALHQLSDAKNRKIEAGRKNLIPHPENLIGSTNHPWTPELKEANSNRMRQIMSIPENRKRISDKLMGRPISPEAREKISKKVKKSHEDGRNKGWITRKNQESYAEAFWRNVLENNHIDYQQEYAVPRSSLGLSGGGCYFLDFLLPGNVDLEIDGHQHYEQSRKDHDHFRDLKLREAGYIVYRIKYTNPKNSIRVREDIDRFLDWYSDLLRRINL